MHSIDHIQSLLDSNQVETAIEALTALTESGKGDKARAYYLLGLAHARLQHWREAQNAYLAAIELDPSSPAVAAFDHMQAILEFYHKDLYNP